MIFFFGERSARDRATGPLLRHRSAPSGGTGEFTIGAEK
jgi:hypothetical protein